MKQLLTEIFYGAAFIVIVLSIVLSVFLCLIIGLLLFKLLLPVFVILLLLACKFLGKIFLLWLDS